MKKVAIILFVILFSFFLSTNHVTSGEVFAAGTCSGNGDCAGLQECYNGYLWNGTACVAGCNRQTSSCVTGVCQTNGICAGATGNRPACGDAGSPGGFCWNPISDGNHNVGMAPGVSCYGGAYGADVTSSEYLCGNNSTTLCCKPNDICGTTNPDSYNSPGGSCQSSCANGNYYQGKDCGSNYCCKPAAASTPTTTPAGPTATPAPSPTPIPATGNVAVFFQGIDSLNNIKPKHQQRQLTLYFYTKNTYGSDPTGTHATYKVTDVVTVNNTNVNDPLNASFMNQLFNLGNIASGDYYILAKSTEGSLRQLLSTQKIHIDASTINTIVNTNTSNGNPNIPILPMGDIVNDNSVDIGSYNIIYNCYGYPNKYDHTKCPSSMISQLSDSTKGFFADINDDGIVDGIDYNILIRDFNNNGN